MVCQAHALAVAGAAVKGSWTRSRSVCSPFRVSVVSCLSAAASRIGGALEQRGGGSSSVIEVFISSMVLVCLVWED